MEKNKYMEKIIAPIVCLLLSIGLWIYINNIENPLITTDITKIPVELLNSSILKKSDLTLEPNQNPTITLKIQGDTQTINKINKNDFKLTVDLSELAIRKGVNTLPVTIVERPSKVSIKNMDTLFISITVEEFVKKEFTIESGIDILATPYYYVAPPMFNPEKVTVSGPESLINKIKSIKAVGEEHNLSESSLKNYEIHTFDESGSQVSGVTLSEKWTQGTIKVNEGKTVPINIITEGTLPSGHKISSSQPSKSKINITGPDELLDSVSSIDTEPIDISYLTETSELDVYLSLPDNIYVNRGEDVITVTLNIETIKTKEFTLGYVVKNLKSDFKIVPKSETATIRVSAFEEDLKAITDDKIKLELNLASFTEPGSYKAKPSATINGINLANPIEVVTEIDFEIIKNQ